jgi:glyoxylase-like metal-dependent hydrolase (beta-lactamase superfamily II)
VYLVEGTEKAVLIDAGIGVGNLRTFVETLTDKPVSVLVTHYHLGGTGGAGDFENVYMHQKDIEWYDKDGGQPLSKRMLSNRPYFASQEKWDKFELKDFPPNRPADQFKAINDGDTFDLGVTSVIAYHVKGHTQGNMAYLVTDQKLLISGEGVSSSVSLMKGDAGLATFEESLKELASKTVGRFDKILISNGDPLPKEVLTYLINACEGVRNGTATIKLNKRKRDEVKLTVFDDGSEPQEVGEIKYDQRLVNE